MASNATYSELPPLPAYTLKPLPPLIPGLPDEYLTLALPIIAYWVVSGIFHVIDELDLFPQYRLHTPTEVSSRNRVSRWDVFRDVVVQQIVQTIFGIALAYIDGTPMYGKQEYDIAWWAQKIRQAQKAVPMVLATVGVDAKSLAGNLGSSNPALAGVLAGGLYPDLVQVVWSSGEGHAAPAFAPWELVAAKIVHHALVPAFQFFVAIAVVDTWQYFLHRAMHMNKWLYTTFHSRHHRLYVPYAYGALYNHPVEGFLLDTLGTGVAYLISGMTVRQSMIFFTASTIKTVDDHCGYSFPWDPLQHITSNNAGYHDIHHQLAGIKSNFSQPFFTFWDTLLGTKWTGGSLKSKRAQATSAPVGGASNANVTKSPTTTVVTSKALSSEVINTTKRVPTTKVKSGSARKRSTGSGLKGFADRVGDSLHGKGTGVLGVENRSR